ncbi:hypothetical protein IHE55_22100 [Streptomyces pactum]|uniref:Uncharacterized protein n=1 Tax=Streptomyces pactum TaxID=68249 RepID=A0ABS0NQ75_9ACTN|nr:hypothetical protein [Streptomyces pactum]MBH5337306.1 hypothetical protein [Streptomyces pactum]
MPLSPPSPGGVRRSESVPFAFVAEAEQFRSNVAPPPRQRAGLSELAGNVLVALVIVAGFVGALLFGLPALGSQSHDTREVQRTEASQGR